jgi:PAS domain S-box-containing protein
MESIVESVNLRMGQDLELRLTSNRYLDHILNGLDGEALVIDNNYIIKNVNSKFLNNYGITRHEVIGSCCYKLKADMNLPCFRNTNKCPLKLVLESNEPVQLCYDSEKSNKLIQNSPTKNIVNYKLSAFPIQGTSGKIDMITEVIYDIPNQNHSKAKSSKSDQKKILKNQLGNIFLSPHNNETYLKILKTLLNGMGGKYGVIGYIDSFGDLVIPALSRDLWEMHYITGENIVIPKNCWKGYWGRALKERMIFCINKPFNTPKRVLPIDKALVVPIVYDNTSIGLIIIGDKEIEFKETDRKLMRELSNYIAPIFLKLSETDSKAIQDEELKIEREIEDMKYRFVFDNVANMIISIDRTRHIVDCNECLEKKLGYDKKYLVGKDIFQLIPDRLIPKAKELWSLLKDTNFVMAEEFKLVSKNNEEIDVIIYPTKFEDAEGTLIENIWIMEDITKRKKAEHKLIRACNRAEVYLDILGHDIEKLNKEIASYSELLLLKPDLSEQYKNYFKTTLNQSKTISKLISNIQKLCSINKEEFEFENIDVFQTLAETAETVRQNYPKRVVKINQSMSESEVLVKSCQMLKDVFFNIIDNAIKFDAHDEVILDIKYSITEDGDFWRLEFLDHGPGIPDDYKSRIFNGFENNNGHVNGNSNGNSTVSNRGSGLGLVVVKEIVRRCGGKVWVEDRISENSRAGSNFIMLLPRGLVG